MHAYTPFVVVAEDQTLFGCVFGTRRLLAMADMDVHEQPETAEVEKPVSTRARVLRYYTPREVAMHNTGEDCWVSIFHRILDLSELIQEHRGLLTQPLILHAGEDISHWFDPVTQDVRKHVDAGRNVELPFLPYGRFLHVPPPEPTSNWSTTNAVPWWKDAKYVVGKLTTKVRWIEIVNVLTQQHHALEVCCEETIEEIQARYLRFNAHARSYTWKYLDDDDFVPLNMKQTLEENGIPDESPLFEKLDMDEQQYKPSLYIYFNDDLTVA